MTAHVPSFTPPGCGSGPYPPNHHEWDTITIAASTSLMALSEFLPSANLSPSMDVPQ